jgi:cytochrome d ubiquinol oxidase subunit II
MNAEGYQGTFFSLLNPYGLLTGALFLLLFALHGSLYLSVKTDGDLCRRAEALAGKLWLPVLLAVAAFLVYSRFGTNLLGNYFAMPALMVIPLSAAVSLLTIRYFMARKAWHRAFAFSCATVFFTTFTGVAGLFPSLIPSSLDPAWSLTIYNTSSSSYTLRIMTVVAFIFVPIVVAYKIWVYRLFRARVTEEDVLKDSHHY